MTLIKEESRIVITGVAGFIGSNLAKHFYNAGRVVIGIDDFSSGFEDNLAWANNCNKNRFQLYTVNICHQAIFDIFQCNDIILHCAGLAPLPINQEQPYHSITNNVAGTANVLEAARRNGAQHVVFASTSAIYENNTNFPCKESDPVQPTLIYSLGKQFCEELCQSFFTLYGLQYTVLRFFNVYGPHHDCMRKNPPFVAYLIKSFYEETVPLLHSNGDQKRDYIYIDDLIALVEAVTNNLSTANTKIYNVASGSPVSVNEIVTFVQSHMKKEHILPIFRSPILLWEKNVLLFSGIMPILEENVKKEVCKYSLGDNTQAFRDFQWKPSVSIEEGLARTIAYTIHALCEQKKKNE